MGKTPYRTVLELMSSNVSGFESIYVKAFCIYANSQSNNTLISDQIKALIGLPEIEKPTFFRKKDHAYILKTMSSLLQQIEVYNKTHGYTSYFLTSNDNNRLGSDLEDTVNNVFHELKLGGITDANIGITSMEWALDIPGDIKNNMVTNGYMIRREMYENKISENDIIAHKEKSKHDLAEIFSQKLIVGNRAPDKLSHLAICLSRGITNYSEIEELYLTKDTPVGARLFALQRNGTFKQYEKAFSYADTFTVKSVGIGINGGGTQIHLISNDTGRNIEFRQHFKNSYTHVKDDIKIRVPAKFWVKTPCFNVWIGR